MKQSVLISIKPKWCELIENGKKTVEVRKTKPKLKTPFKCYIYSSKDKWDHLVQNPDKTYEIYNGKDYGKYDKSLKFENERNGKVIGEYICDDIRCYTSTSFIIKEDAEIALQGTCITEDELYKYLDWHKGVPIEQQRFGYYAWHISDLKIYDEPKELEAFKLYNRDCYYSNLGLAIPRCKDCTKCNLIKLPQSWCYVEGKNE